MCNGKKDFSLLRPFDLEAAKRGDEFLFIPLGDIAQKTRKLVSEKNGQIVMDCGEHFQICTVSFAYSEYKMAPLCWVRTSVEDDTLKPVYKGDVLYSSFFKNHPQDRGNYTGRFVVGGLYSKLLIKQDDPEFRTKITSCTWTPPKVKRKIKMLGFRNVYNGEILLKNVISDLPISWERFPQLDTTVEIEE